MRVTGSEGDAGAGASLVGSVSGEVVGEDMAGVEIKLWGGFSVRGGKRGMDEGGGEGECDRGLTLASSSVRRRARSSGFICFRAIMFLMALKPALFSIAIGVAELSVCGLDSAGLAVPEKT